MRREKPQRPYPVSAADCIYVKHLQYCSLVDLDVKIDSVSLLMKLVPVLRSSQAPSPNSLVHLLEKVALN